MLVFKFDLLPRIIVADGSSNLTTIVNALSMDSSIKILAKPKTALETLSRVIRERPDVLVMSTNMTDMDIDKLISRVMDKTPVAILVLKDKDDVKFYGSKYGFGLVDNLSVGFKSSTIGVSGVAMTTRIHILAKINVDKFKSKIKSAKRGEKPTLMSRLNIFPKKRKSDIRSNPDRSRNKRLMSRTNFRKKLCVIGASTGGPKMITTLVQALPNKFPPVIIIQHMPDGFVSSFTKRLNRMSEIEVRQAEDGQIVEQNTVYVCPGGLHLEVVKEVGELPRLRLFRGELVNFVRPAVDLALKSAAKVYGANLIGVILTGMGSDGREGAREVRAVGGKMIALNKEDSTIYGMNKAVIEAGHADIVLPVNKIISGIISYL